VKGLTVAVQMLLTPTNNAAHIS